MLKSIIVCEKGNNLLRSYCLKYICWGLVYRILLRNHWKIIREIFIREKNKFFVYFIVFYRWFFRIIYKKVIIKYFLDLKFEIYFIFIIKFIGWIKMFGLIGR